MTEPAEKWGPEDRKSSRVVDLEGAEVRLTRNTLMGPRVTVYAVDRVDVRTQWTVGQEEEGRTVAILHARERIGDRQGRPGILYLRDLDEVPPWLDSIITRATPRDIGN